MYKGVFSTFCLVSCFFCLRVSIPSRSVVSPEEEQSGAVCDPRWSTAWQKCHLFLFYLSLTGFPRQDRPSRTPWCRRPSGKKQMLVLAPALCSSPSPDGHSRIAQLSWFNWSCWDHRLYTQRLFFQGRQSHMEASLLALKFLARLWNSPVGPSPPCRGIRMGFRQRAWRLL